MKKFTVRGQNDGPHVLITGGVHGDEHEPIAAVTELIGLFQGRHDAVADLRGSVTLVAIVNESAYSRRQRCGEDGLDLARTCPGRADGTVTERTAHELSQLIRQADFYIDLHTGGQQMNVYPLAGFMLHQDPAIVADQRRMALAFNLPLVWGTSAELDGRSLSVARDAGIPAIYCEYLGSESCSREGITAYVEGCLNVLGELDMLTRPPVSSRVEYFIEDPRPASGHLQICHPSPITGYFESAAPLGKRVKQGELFGTVTDPDRNRSYPIEAEHDGIVVTVRTLPQVSAGESVGVIADLALSVPAFPNGLSRDRPA